MPHEVTDDQHRRAVVLDERVVPVTADRRDLRGRQVPDDDLGLLGTQLG
jgi:hypothetical protein